MNRLTKSIPAALLFMFLKISCNTFHINQSSIQKVLSSSKNKPNNKSNDDDDIMDKDKDGNGNENLDINIDTDKNKEDEDTLKDLISVEASLE
jgi:hypothetical protein